MREASKGKRNEKMNTRAVEESRRDLSGVSNGSVKEEK
jgi:hypothetical protein